MSVAIAGGSGGLGRALIEVIQARGTYQVFVLTRKVSGSPEGSGGLHFIAVDYSDVESLASTLEKNKIDTVISAINNITGENDSEINLIKAAEISAPTKRFIPSYFGVPYSQEQYENFPPAMAKRSALTALESTSLQWTVIYNGFFLDYFGTPKVKSYMDDVAFFVDIKSNMAAIPGSGEVPVVFTHTFDVGRFIAALLESHTWAAETYIIGDKATFHQVVRLAEEVKGTKFVVAHDSVQDLAACKLTELPSHRAIYQFYPKEMLHSFLAPFGLECERGQANLNPGRTLNAEYPDIKPMKLRDVLELGWGKAAEGTI
ncbi:NmrA-like family protein [Colletotrichum truncatum]|uniref:NmrA-like family protein n=1 Tax=Colletotrichum truncatum TaxID=5467 RepID=A0ACC3YK71_COLTU|nr:NmrA-like family protein [Colletotrichum truncatum]KAF6784376.1 NmrA-like family protein [Colletotrichum truncatum]